MTITLPTTNSVIEPIINYVATLESVAHITMQQLNWSKGLYIKRDSLIDHMTLEEVLNSYTYELLRNRNVGNRKIDAIKDCVAEIFPRNFLAKVPLFNEFADKILTRQQIERDALKQEKEQSSAEDLAQLISHNIKLYGLDEDDEDKE